MGWHVHTSTDILTHRPAVHRVTYAVSKSDSHTRVPPRAGAALHRLARGAHTRCGLVVLTVNDADVQWERLPTSRITRWPETLAVDLAIYRGRAVPYETTGPVALAVSDQETGPMFHRRDSVSRAPFAGVGSDHSAVGSRVSSDPGDTRPWLSQVGSGTPVDHLSEWLALS